VNRGYISEAETETEAETEVEIGNAVEIEVGVEFENRQGGSLEENIEAEPGWRGI
jgi:cytochrome oxidase assembly protein ShyY1